MQGMLSETTAAESYIQGFRDCAELIIDVMSAGREPEITNQKSKWKGYVQSRTL